MTLALACAKEEQSSEGASGESTETSGDGDGDSVTTDSPPTTAGTTFVPDNDVQGIASCDPISQDCPEGEKCVAYVSGGDTWDANRCVMVTGTGTFGDSCVYDGAVEGSDDCDGDHVCWNALEVDGQLIGTCFPFCTGTIDSPVCDDPGTTCRVVNDGVITVCLPDCDPLIQECDEGLGCYWSGGSGTFQCIITAGGIPTGEPCGYNNDCNPGNFCAATDVLEGCEGSGCCASFCDTSEDPISCTDPYDCVSFFEEGTAPPMYESLGLCILPL